MVESAGDDFALLALATAAFAEDTAKAREAFLKGQALYSASKYKDALAKFEESYAAKPHPATIFNIARCQDQLGDFVKAMTSYKEYLRQSPQASDADDVVKAIATIEQKLQAKGSQHLLVYADPPTARVAVDGKDIGVSPAATTIAPGSHKVVITAEGFDPYERAFAMSASRSMEMTVSLRPATPPVAKVDPVKTDPVKPKDPVKTEPTKVDPKPPPKTEPVKVSDAKDPVLTPPPPGSTLITDEVPPPKRRVFTWVAAGTAGVAAGLGVAFSIAMKNNEAALRTLDANRTREQATTLYNGAYGMGTAATISFITAGVAAAAAVLLFFLEGA